ncbi:MAG: hypothetical protein ACRDOK_12770 [Streptosporangiaceae bacterium]
MRASYRRWLDAKAPEERRAYLGWLLGYDLPAGRRHSDGDMPDHVRAARDAFYARLGETTLNRYGSRSHSGREERR